MLQSVNVPDDDPTVVRLKKALSDRAEIDILGAQNYKTKRTFDTMETAAGNEGSGAVGAGMGLGMGLGAGASMGQMMGGMMGSVAQTTPTQVVACGSCKAQVPATSKFCPECGGPVVAPTSKCPSCKADVAAGAKFCGTCGKKLGSHACPKCNAEVAPTAGFCGGCGKKMG